MGGPEFDSADSFNWLGDSGVPGRDVGGSIGRVEVTAGSDGQVMIDSPLIAKTVGG